LKTFLGSRNFWAILQLKLVQRAISEGEDPIDVIDKAMLELAKLETKTRKVKKIH